MVNFQVGAAIVDVLVQGENFRDRDSLLVGNVEAGITLLDGVVLAAAGGGSVALGGSGGFLCGSSLLFAKVKKRIV